jgi:hypothetical protein
MVVAPSIHSYGMEVSIILSVDGADIMMLSALSVLALRVSESIILSVPLAESMILSAPLAESMILSAPPADATHKHSGTAH